MLFVFKELNDLGEGGGQGHTTSIHQKLTCITAWGRGLLEAWLASTIG